MKSEMPELIIAEGATPQNLFMYQSGVSQGMNLEGTINLEKLATDAQKVELKFGRVEFTDKKGNKVKGLNPNIFKSGDSDSDSYLKSTKTTKTRRKYKKKKKSKRKGSMSPPTAPSLTNSSKKGKNKKSRIITIKKNRSKFLNPYDPYAQF
jgi:hypothetical protein